MSFLGLLSGASGSFLLPIVLLLLGIYWIFFKPNKYEKYLSSLPGPKPYPIVGNALHFIGSKDETLPKMLDWCNTYGSRFKCYFGFDPFVFLWNVEDLEKLMSSKQHIEKGTDYDFLMPWLGTGLLTNKGESWSKRRKMLTPSFHFQILDQFIDVFNDHTFKMIEIWKKEFPSPNQTFDVCPFIKRCTLDIICETAMGKKLNAQEERDTPYLNAIHGIGHIFEIRTLRPWLGPDFIWRLSSYGKEEPKLLSIVHAFTDDVIQERKQKFLGEKQRGASDQIEDMSSGVRKKRAFLDLLLEAQLNPENGLTDADIRQETDTFMFGGHDTTAANIGFTLYLLGTHPAIQAKVQAELDDIFAEDKTRPITTQDFAHMKYLEACIKESLRLYPSAPMITRKLQSDLVLDDGVILPTGVSLIITIIQLHRDPKHFPNPNEFKPERFISDSEHGKNRHPYAYIPFSAGPRNCIGQKFAMMEEKVFIANILRHFTIKSVESELTLIQEITLSSKSGIKISLQPR